MNIINETPVHYVETYAGAKIYIKREDLLPFSYGGNKVRIAVALIKAMKNMGCDTIISYGSASSNMNRAIAQLAQAEGINCHVIIKKDENSGMNTIAAHLNERLVIWSGADITYCTAQNVRETVEDVMKSIRSRGGRPYYIYGDSSGQGNSAVLMSAYFDVFREIRQQEKKNGIQFDHIFIAVGTGASISGLVAVRQQERMLSGFLAQMIKQSDVSGISNSLSRLINSPRIHGISVARKAEAERKIILKNLMCFDNEAFDTEIIDLESPNPDLDGFDITDDYLCSGYGGGCADIEREISHMLKDCGVPLDPVYTGKAYYGMKQEIIKKGYGGNCLFIHTGGLPLLLDNIDIY